MKLEHLPVLDVTDAKGALYDEIWAEAVRRSCGQDSFFKYCPEYDEDNNMPLVKQLLRENGIADNESVIILIWW